MAYGWYKLKISHDVVEARFSSKRYSSSITPSYSIVCIASMYRIVVNDLHAPMCHSVRLRNKYDKLSTFGFLSYVTWTTVLKGGTDETDVCYGVAMADDGSVVVAGYTWGDWDGVNAGGYDFVAIKLDAAGEEVWVWQVRHVRSSFR